MGPAKGNGLDRVGHVLLSNATVEGNWPAWLSVDRQLKVWSDAAAKADTSYHLGI